jgi:formate hydrogenlyase subunit 3/multisubunit Na+/H+ antiporter MnhD subunit
MLDPVLVPATVLGLFALALLAPWVGRAVRGAAGPLFALYPAAAALFFASRAGQIAQGRPVTASLDWVPSLGVNLAFHVDGLALLFALLICGIGALVLIYAGGYLRGHPGLPASTRFCCSSWRDARPGAGRQRADAVRLLGADQHQLIPADRLRPRAPGGAVGRRCRRCS